MAREARSRKPNLSHHKAVVSIHRNGLTIEIGNVRAVDAGLVAAELLRVVRTLTKPFPELVLDAGHLGGGAGIEVDDEDDGPDGSDPLVARRVVGFTR